MKPGIFAAFAWQRRVGRLAQAVAFCRLEGRLQDFRGESSAGRAFGRSQTLRYNVCASPPPPELLRRSLDTSRKGA